MQMCWVCHVNPVEGLFNSPKEVETQRLRTALENSERDPLVPKVCECCMEWGFLGNTPPPATHSPRINQNSPEGIE